MSQRIYFLLFDLIKGLESELFKKMLQIQKHDPRLCAKDHTQSEQW